eukprot:2855235-Prymnesium_polylepis.1
MSNEEVEPTSPSIASTMVWSLAERRRRRGARGGADGENGSTCGRACPLREARRGGAARRVPA